LLQRRLAVLDVKNAVADLLFRLQRPLAENRLDSLARVRELLVDPEKRKRLISITPSRSVIEEELSRTPGVELGRTLDLALGELVAEGVVLRIPGKDVSSSEDVFLSAPSSRPPHWDTAELNRLVREGVSQAAELQRRERRRSTTDGSRSYDL
jgi:hypothetical protein